MKLTTLKNKITNKNDGIRFFDTRYVTTSEYCSTTDTNGKFPDQYIFRKQSW